MGIVNTISKAPRWLLLGVSVLVLGGFGYAVVASSGLVSKKKPAQAPQQVVIDVPDAPIDQYSTTALEEYKRSKANGRHNVADWWDTMEDGKADPLDDVALTPQDDLDPSVYSELEITNIRNGFWTKAQVDAEHERQRQYREQLAREERESLQRTMTPQYTQAQQDSMYFARLEKAYALAGKYVNTSTGGEEKPAEPKPAEEPARKLDLEENAGLPTDSFDGNGIICSLDDSPTVGGVVGSANFKARPVKATFLKKEKLVSGNRVILRVMQDMQLSDGTVIPANTHITGICQIGDRLRININRLNYNGKLFSVDISVYDTDGTEGIYCPKAEASSKKKAKAKEVASSVLSQAAGVATSLLGRSPVMGSMAATGINAVTSSVMPDGTVTVNVTSGYEFFVYENIKDKDSKTNKR